MFKLNRIRLKVQKKLGRGYGSGKGGHTVGKGQKGQKTRSTLGVLFEGVKTKKSFVKRLPFIRGKSKFKANKKPVSIDLSFLDKLPKEAHGLINADTLLKYGLIKKSKLNKYGVKLLGGSPLKMKIKVSLPVSGRVKQNIIKAGGEIISSANTSKK